MKDLERCRQNKVHGPSWALDLSPLTPVSPTRDRLCEVPPHASNPIDML
jgi:hypothetical protein